MIFTSFTSSGQQCNVIKRYFAYLKIKQDIKRGSRSNYKNLLDKAKEMALKYNFVTDLTSLVVVVPEEDSDRSLAVPSGSGPSNSPTALSTGGNYVLGAGNAGGGGALGPQQAPVDPNNIFNVSSVISPWTISAKFSPCNITLYSDDYYTGDSINLSDNVPDLALWDFQEKLMSVKVEGSCSWKLFTGKSLSLSW